MPLPNAEARAAILRACLAPLPEALRATADLPAVVAATEGLTGADLKRLVEDAKNLLGFDRAQSRPSQPLTTYFLAAVQSLQTNKDRYVQAEAKARQQHPSRPVYFDD
jgi:SpoVK/Ycf46/Vps4 family AAA+-type ATPase